MHNKNEASKMREDNPNQLESNKNPLFWLGITD